jgi:hypothetical protein
MKKTKRNLLYLFNWDKIPGEDDARLLKHLKQKFGAYWAKGKIEKINDYTIKVSIEFNSLSLNLKDEKTVSVKIDDGRTEELIVRRMNGNLNVYPKPLVEKPARMLKDFLKTQMKKSASGKWINPYSKKQKEFKYRSKAVEEAINYFLSERYGEERRVKQLGEEWRHIGGYHIVVMGLYRKYIIK